MEIMKYNRLRRNPAKYRQYMLEQAKKATHTQNKEGDQDDVNRADKINGYNNNNNNDDSVASPVTFNPFTDKSYHNIFEGEEDQLKSSDSYEEEQEDHEDDFDQAIQLYEEIEDELDETESLAETITELYDNFDEEPVVSIKSSSVKLTINVNELVAKKIKVLAVIKDTTVKDMLEEAMEDLIEQSYDVFSSLIN